MKKLLGTYSKLTEKIWVLDENDLGGVTNSDEEVCAICGTTQICMPYKSSAGGLVKAEADEGEDVDGAE